MSNFDYPTSGERLNSAQRDQLLEQVKQQVALASAQELIQVEYSLILWRFFQDFFMFFCLYL